MKATEIKSIISSLKKGKIYFKPLPYGDVIGGTWIHYDKSKKKYVERYINESVFDRGREDYTREMTLKQLKEMFTDESYTDRKYIISKKSEKYELVDEFKVEERW